MVDFKKLSKLHTAVRQHLTRYYQEELDELEALEDGVVAAYIVGRNRTTLPFSGFNSTCAAIAAVTAEVRYVRGQRQQQRRA